MVEEYLSVQCSLFIFQRQIALNSVAKSLVIYTGIDALPALLRVGPLPVNSSPTFIWSPPSSFVPLMWQHIFKFKLFHVQYFNGLWTKASLSFFVIIMTMSRSAGRCQSRSNLLIAKLRVATRETSQVSLSSSSPSSLPNQSVHHRKANSLHRHCPKRRAPRPYQHQTQHHCHLGIFEGVSYFSLSPSSLVSPLSGKTNGAEKQEGGSNVANVLWSSQVPPGPSPSRKSTTQNPLAAGN